MRIENIILTNMILNDKNFFLNENSILRGRVISRYEDSATIKFPQLGIIEAEIDALMDLEEGEEIKFIVREASDKGISLKAILDENPSKPQVNNENKNSVLSLLKEYNIEENNKTISLVQAMMKQNLSISKDNILSSLKTLEKFIDLSLLDEGKEVTIIKPPSLGQSSSTEGLVKGETKPEEIEIKYFIINEAKGQIENKSEKIQHRDSDFRDRDKTGSVREDVKKNMLEGNPIEKEDFASKGDLKEIIKEALGTYSQEKEESFIKTIALFMKSGIKVNLNNIKHMTSLNEDPLDFIKEIKDFLARDHKDLDKILPRINQETSKEKDIRLIPTSKEKLEEISRTVEDLLKTEDPRSDQKLNSLSSKLDFLKDLDKDFNFLFYPLNLGEKKDLEGLFSFVKDKRPRSNNKKDIKIFISLNTKNLGNVKVFSSLANDLLEVKIHIKEEDFEVFKNSEDKLIEKINLIGYSVNGIDFVVDKEFALMDYLEDSLASTYLLDLKA